MHVPGDREHAESSRGGEGETGADPADAVIGSRSTDAFRDISARVLFSVATAGCILIVLVAVPLAVYPALIKFFPTTLATLAVPFRLAKGLEFAYFVVSFGLLLPLGLWLAWKYVRWLERRGIDPFVVGYGNVVAALLVVAAAKISMAGAPGIGAVGREHWVRPLAWAVLAAVALLLSANLVLVRRPRLLEGRSVPRPDVLLFLLVVVLPLAFMPSRVFTLSGGFSAAAITVIVLAAFVAVAALSHRVPSTRLAGVLAVLVIVVLTWDLHLTRGEPLIRQAHWRTVYLGPANSVLHGGTMLVDVFAQYGPGTTYFIAGVFRVVPISFGHFWLLTQVLDVVVFVLVYCIFRATGIQRLGSLAGALLALLTGVLVNPMVDTLVPERPWRIFLPLIVLLLVVAAARRARPGRWTSWLLAATIGICSIWAVEVFVYALAIAFCAWSCRARLDAIEGALRIDRAEVARVVGAIAATQMLFAVATRSASGHWPNWLRYLEYTRVYASGAGSQPFAPFKPGLLLGLFYFVSAATLATLLIRARAFMVQQRSLAVALAAANGFAVGYFSYYAGESQVTNTYKMAPAAVVLAVMWLALVARGGGRDVRLVGAGLAFVGLWAATLGVLAHPHNTLHHLERTALFSSPETTWRDVRFVAQSPVADPRAVSATAFVRRLFPGQERVLVLLPEELTTEVLLRTRRVELIPMSDPYGENFLPTRVSYLEQRVSSLPVGTRFVTNAEIVKKSQLAAINDLDARLVRTLAEKYHLAQVQSGPEGLRAYELVGRRG